MQVHKNVSKKTVYLTLIQNGKIYNDELYVLLKELCATYFDDI